MKLTEYLTRLRMFFYMTPDEKIEYDLDQALFNTGYTLIPLSPNSIDLYLHDGVVYAAIRSDSKEYKMKLFLDRHHHKYIYYIEQKDLTTSFDNDGQRNDQNWHIRVYSAARLDELNN